MRKNPVATLAGSSLPRSVGRPHKPGGAVSDKDRKQAQRLRERAQQQREQLEREAAARDAYWAKMKEEAAKEHPDNKGRSSMEVSKSPADLIKIFHAKSADGEVNYIDGGVPSYDTPTGHRVKPEGHGSYSNQESFSSSRDFAEAGRSRSGFEAQDENPASRYQRWTTQDGVENKTVLQVRREFVKAHVIAYCPLPRVDGDGMRMYCNLPMDAATRKEHGVPRGMTAKCLFSAVAETGDEQFKQAKKHIKKVHVREFNKYLRDRLPELPAWMDRSRERELKGKPFKGECPKKARHEEWRLKAVERHNKILSEIAVAETEDQKKQLLAQIESLACPVCKQTIYIPPTPKYAPEESPEKRKAEKEEHQEQRSRRRRFKADPVSPPRNLPFETALKVAKVLSQQDLPDLT